MKPKPAPDKVKNLLDEQQDEGPAPWQIGLALAHRDRQSRARAEIAVYLTLGIVLGFSVGFLPLKFALILIGGAVTTSVLFVATAIKSRIDNLEHKQSSLKGFKRVNLDEEDAATATGDQ